MLTQEQIAMVKKSWRILRMIDPKIIAGTFYAKLFNDYPRLRRMFPKEMEPQYVKLMDMLSSVVARLDRLSELSAEIADMTERHTGYGVKPEHYTLVGHALLWTLEKGLGKDWSPELKEAWTNAYTELATQMTNASATGTLHA